MFNAGSLNLKRVGKVGIEAEAVRTESHVRLAEAVDLAGTDEAGVEAARRVGDLLVKHAAELWSDEEWRMDVTNEAGLILIVVHVSA